MRPGTDTKSPTATLSEEMFREALELAHRVNRRITDGDGAPRRDRDAKPRANEAAGG